MYAERIWPFLVPSVAVSGGAGETSSPFSRGHQMAGRVCSSSFGVGSLTYRLQFLFCLLNLQSFS